VSELAKDLHMRTCLLHPYELAVSNTGHVHIYEDLKIIAGWCKDCQKNDMATEIEGGGSCEGCCGKIGGLR
jgi:hypothetical protein